MMQQTSRLRCAFGMVVVAVLVGLGIAACSGSSKSDTDQPTGVKVMLDWSPNTNHAGMYLAREKGYYRDVGLDVTFLEPGQGGDPNKAVATGTVDFGVTASEQLVPARAAGVPVVSIAAIIQHNTSSLIALAESGISRPRDLEGHTYGSYGATFEEELVKDLVSCDGGDPSKVTFTQVGDADYRQGLTSGHYDSVWVFDGWDVIRLADIDGLKINRMPFADYRRCIPDWYTPILITSQKLIDADPGLVRRFSKATAQGYREAMAHPDLSATALLDGAKGLDPDLVKRSADYLATHYTDDPSRWGHQDPVVWNRFVGYLEKQHIVDPGFDTSAAFTNEFLPGES